MAGDLGIDDASRLDIADGREEKLKGKKGFL